MSTFSDMDSSLNDDNLFAMELDLTSFAQSTPPTSTILSLGTSDKLVASPSGILTASPSVDQLLLNQISHDIGILTPTPQSSLLDNTDINNQPQPSAHIPVATTEQAMVTRPFILVEHIRSPVQSYIPSSFSPLKIVGDYFVDDSKYQAGGRFVYKRLYKYRRTSVPNPYTPYRRESRLLPFYQPGKDQEWIVPPRKEKPPKTKSRAFSLNVNWNASKRVVSTPLKREELEANHPPAVTKHSVAAATAWGISSLSLQQLAKSKEEEEEAAEEEEEEEEEGSSDSDSDSSSTSTGDSDDDNLTESSHPRFGKLTKQSDTSNDFHESSVVESWSVRGVNSAMFVDAAMCQSTDHSIGGLLMGLGSSAISHCSRPTSRARITELESDKERTKPWLSAQDYHVQVEFDTPFTPAILSVAPPALVVSEPAAIQESLAAEYFLEAVKTLCEQAVMGDYPFAGSNEVTGTSGEITEGESFHAMLTRWKTMSGFLHSGVATVPALGDESFRNVMEMKAIIFDLFDRLRGNQSDNVVALPVPSDASQDMTMSKTTIHGHRHHSSQSNITPPPVVMKGPLTLFQYFSLAEAQQMPSKYGKYQVKKKKPVEPALVQLQPPDIVVGHNEEWLEAAPTILRFWEKLSLEPYSNRKNISYFVVYPEGADMENSVCKFWRELSVVFETSLLGKHQAGILQDYKPGLVPISLLPALPGETMEARQVRSYLDGCQQLGLILGGNSALRDMHTVVYMINPFSHGAGYFDLCRCFSIMKTQFRTAAMGSLMTPLEQQRERLVLQLVPIQHVIYPSTFGGYLRFGLKDIAFTVYSKCKVFLERPVYSQGTMAQFNLYAPSFALAKTLPAAIHYESGQKPNMVPKPQATIHVGYGFSLDKRWLICVWTDHRGEMLEHMTMDMTDNSHQVTLSTRQPSSNININGATTTTTRRSLEACLQEIWARTLVYQKRALFNWKTVICKLGLMPRPELQAWIRLTGNATHTSIVAVNMDSPLRMYPHNRGTELLSSSSGMISNASGIITPKTPNIGTSSSMVATSLSQGLGTNASAVSGAGAPDGSTAATTHMSSAGGHGAGTTGLGIAGAPGVVAAGGNPGSQAGGGGAAGVGGLAPGEELENSVGQVYAMLLNHRVPLIVSRQESSWFGGGGSGGNEKRELGLLEQQQAATNDESESKAMVKGSAGQESVGGQEQETKGDVIMGDSFLVSLTSSSSSLSRTMDQNQDVDMDAKMKQEEVDSQQPLSAKSEQQQEQQQQRAERKQASFSAVGNDVILPLSTGYLIQVPIQSNSVMREKHSLEAMGVEVHLLHLQRTPMSSVGSIFPGATASGSSSTGGHGSPLPHHQQQQQQQQQQQHSTAYHLQRHNSVNISGSNSGSGSSNGNPSVPGQSFRTSTYPPPPQYPGTSPLLSSSSTFMGSGNNNNSNNNNGGGNGGSGGGGLSHPQGPNQTQQQAAGGAGGAGGGGVGNTTTVKATVAASTTREILKQFHALSYLSMSPVQTNCLPHHLVLVERLSRVLLLVQD